MTLTCYGAVVAGAKGSVQPVAFVDTVHLALVPGSFGDAAVDTIHVALIPGSFGGAALQAVSLTAVTLA